MRTYYKNCLRFSYGVNGRSPDKRSDEISITDRKPKMEISNRQKKMQKPHSLIFPIYLQCSEIEADSFWKQFFLHLSFGPSPRCLFISTDGNIFKLDQKKPLVLKDKKPEEIINEAKAGLIKNYWQRRATIITIRIHSI